MGGAQPRAVPSTPWTEPWTGYALQPLEISPYRGFLGGALQRQGQSGGSPPATPAAKASTRRSSLGWAAMALDAEILLCLEEWTLGDGERTWMDVVNT